MSWKIALLLGVAGIILSLKPAFGSIIYVSGDVSGTWSADTVIVTGEVRVPPGETLIIMPGTEVFFEQHYKFIVDQGATLSAIGTQNDSIRFDEGWQWTGLSWHGIRFLSSSGNSRLEYCHLTNGLATGIGEDMGGAIYCSGSSPTISRNTISGNSVTLPGLGGGIYCTDSSSPSISDNTISGNSAGYGGGIYCYANSNPTISGNTINGNQGSGIYCYESSPSISDNTISGNSASSEGGGIGCRESSPTITGNTISGNSANYNGGGICCYANSNPTISGNTISANSTAPYSSGGGISCSGASPSISGNTISGNSASGGGGIHCSESSPVISGNTISGNSATSAGGISCLSNSNPTIIGNVINGNTAEQGGGIGFDEAILDTFEFNEITNNSASDYGGGIYLGSTSQTLNKNTIAENAAVQGGGIYSTGSSSVLINCILWSNDPDQIYLASGSNLQATYSDIQSGWSGTGNLNADPLFVDASGGNYLLQAGSPCINSGDPDPIYNDPNSSRADMGCYYYGVVGVSEPESPELPTAFALLSCHPNPFNPNTVLSFELRVPSFVRLEVFDVNVRNVGAGLRPALTEAWYPAGAHQITFDGSGLPSGIYFAKLKAGDYQAVQKLVLLK